MTATIYLHIKLLDYIDMKEKTIDGRECLLCLKKAH